MYKKIGLSIDRLQMKYGLSKALEIAKEVGAEAVDVMIDHEGHERNDYRNPASIYSKSDEEIIAYFSDIKAKADQLGVEISQTHGRMRGFHADIEENKDILENARRDCLVTSVLGAPVCVMHGVSRKWMGNDVSSKVIKDLTLDMYLQIIPFAKMYNVKIATETLNESINDLLVKYNCICAVGDNKDYFSVCMDTGHTNVAVHGSSLSLGDAIRMLGSSISVLHLHDNNGLKDQHKLPMTGDIDWKDVLQALEEVGYNGVYNLELKLEEFGQELQVSYAKFAVEVMKNMINNGN